MCMFVSSFFFQYSFVCTHQVVYTCIHFFAFQWNDTNLILLRYSVLMFSEAAGNAMLVIEDFVPDRIYQNQRIAVQGWFDHWHNQLEVFQLWNFKNVLVLSISKDRQSCKGDEGEFFSRRHQVIDYPGWPDMQIILCTINCHTKKTAYGKTINFLFLFL